MLRQLLTLFAILTGFAATAAPAEARLAGAETRMEAAFEIVVTADRRQQQAALAPVPAVAHALRESGLVAHYAAPGTPGVRIGIDRARE